MKRSIRFESGFQCWEQPMKMTQTSKDTGYYNKLEEPADKLVLEDICENPAGDGMEAVYGKTKERCWGCISGRDEAIAFDEINCPSTYGWCVRLAGLLAGMALDL